MKSNRKFDVSLDGSLLSHTTNLNAFVLTPTVRTCQVRDLKNRRYQLTVATFELRASTFYTVVLIYSYLFHGYSIVRS